MVTIAIDCRTIIGFVLLLFALLPDGHPMDLLRSKFFELISICQQKEEVKKKLFFGSPFELLSHR